MASIQGSQAFQSAVLDGVLTTSDINLILAADPSAVVNRITVTPNAVDANGTWLDTSGQPLLSATGEPINQAYIAAHGMTLDTQYGFFVINPTTGEILTDSNGNLVLSENASGHSATEITNALRVVSDAVTASTQNPLSALLGIFGTSTSAATVPGVGLSFTLPGLGTNGLGGLSGTGGLGSTVVGTGSQTTDTITSGLTDFIQLLAGGGNDTITGGGYDTIVGSGNDTIVSGVIDFIIGGAGNDSIIGGSASNLTTRSLGLNQDGGTEILGTNSLSGEDIILG